MGIANRVVLLALTRIASYGLMFLSPLVLVRLLSVEQFGQYREFLLYVGIMQTLAAFSIPDSLLYFVAAHPESPWRVVKHSAVLTLASSGAMTAVLIITDTLAHGALVGPYRWPLAVSTLCATNLDFWEWFWVARRRPAAVFAYSAGRLFARLSVVIAAAALTHDVRVIVWSFVGIEGVRLALSAFALWWFDRSSAEPPLAHPWREFLNFCVPGGIAAALQMVSRNVSNVAVVKLIGSVGLAQYAIGRFGEPIVLALRNSISSVVLPEMVHRDRIARERSLALWQQALVANAIFLFPVAVLVAWNAHLLVTTLFGADYAPAASVLQLYMLVVVRECFDFSPPLRAVGSTRPIVVSNIASAATCAAALFLLIPRYGVAGAMAAYVLASFVDAAVLAVATMATYRARLRRLVPWASLAKVGFAALAAGIALAGAAPPGVPAMLGDAIAAVVYLAIFAVLLMLLRVPEALLLAGWLRRTVSGIVVRGV